MGSASARGDRWTFLEAADFTTPECGTDILETVVDRGQQRELAEPTMLDTFRT